MSNPNMPNLDKFGPMPQDLDTTGAMFEGVCDEAMVHTELVTFDLDTSDVDKHSDAKAMAMAKFCLVECDDVCRLLED